MNYRKKILARIYNAPRAETSENPDVVNGLTFRQWYRKLDAIVSSNYGLGMDDFPDWDSYSSFSSGMTPEEGFEDFKDSQDDLPF